MNCTVVAPSVLSADFSSLKKEIQIVEEGGAHWIHWDIMDGHFVPNITFGPCVVESFRPYTKLPFDVHLMIEPVDSYIEAFAKAGANSISIHPEASVHFHRSLQKIKSLGLKAGLALNPGTPPAFIESVTDILDYVLVMTVNPGFGGQKFLPSQLEKIRHIKRFLDKVKPTVQIQVDGGISFMTAPLVVEAGASILVAGSAIFDEKPENYKNVIQALTQPLFKERKESR